MKPEALPIRPYARLLTMLGDQLIKNERIALVELIKNAYDADAGRVEVRFEGFGDDMTHDDSSRIVVRDDGAGMSLDTVRTRWMNPAAPQKYLDKQKGRGRTPGKQRVIQGDPHAFARSGVPDRSLFDPVSVVLQNHRLDTDLHSLGVVRAERDVRALALFEIDGHHEAVADIDDIHLRDDPEPLRRERYRADTSHFHPEFFRRRQAATALVDTRVDALALCGVRTLRPLPLDPFQIREPGTIHPLVDHTGRHERRRGIGRRGSSSIVHGWLAPGGVRA